MTVLVKILLYTIKKNPDYLPPGMVRLMEGRKTVEIFAETRLPKSLEKYFVCMGYQLKDDEPRDFAYSLHGALPKRAANRLQSMSGVQVSMTHTPRGIVDGFSPIYLYKYANPLIKCDECGNMVRFKDIQSGFLVTDDDEYNADQCPVCKELNTFDYKLEPIESALKRKTTLQ